MKNHLLTFLGLGIVACGGDSGTAPPTDGGLSDAVIDNAIADAPFGTPVSGDSVIQHHKNATRDGLYIQPSFTKAAAANLKLDTAFDGKISGNVYAQVLFVDNGPQGKSIVIATTESNEVTALDSVTGKPIWNRTLGPSAANSGAGCGNVHPLGITGTGVIDANTRTLFVSAAMGSGGANSNIKTHELHALSVDDGSERPGFPVDIAKATLSGRTFSPQPQNQRGALLDLNGTVYVPYGGHYGDCADYHGWVVGIPIGSPQSIGAWDTEARGAGIWAVGGLSSDGQSVFAATGNSINANSWQGGEAVLRLGPGPVFTKQNSDFFVPNDWVALDQADTDIGGTGPLVVDVPGATPSKIVVALGKNGVAYLLDRANFGGISAGAAQDGISNTQVANGEIINAAATVTTTTGTWVIFHGYQGALGNNCKFGSAGDLVALKISATSPPKATVEWCADSKTQGSPIITTTNGSGSDAIVWEVGDRVLGWDVDTGTLVFNGGGAGDAITNVRRFTSPIVAKSRLYIGADNKVFAFKL